MELSIATPAPSTPAAAETTPRVLFVTRKWAPAMGGMETYSHRLTDTLAELAPVDVVALPGRADGMPPSALALLLFPFTVLRRLLGASHRPSVVHLGDMALWPLGLMARLFTPGAQIVLSAHGTDVAYPRRGGIKGWLYGAYLKVGARLLGTARVIANSRATRAVAAETGWQDAAIVPLATDLAPQAAAPGHNGAILFAGRLVERKGCGWFIRNVLPLLPDTIRMDVAGTGWDAGEIAALDDPRVTFLGALAPSELARAYAEALCVIVPNIEPASGEYEGFGLVAAEAAAAGGIVLAADHGGLTDAVVDGVTGHLVPCGDRLAWRDAVLSLTRQDAGARTAFLIRAQAHAADYFSWQRVARDTLAAYSD